MREERGMRRVRGVERAGGVGAGRGARVPEPAGIVGRVDVGLVDGAGTGGGRAMVSREAAGWRLDAGF